MLLVADWNPSPVSRINALHKPALLLLLIPPPEAAALCWLMSFGLKPPILASICVWGNVRKQTSGCRHAPFAHWVTPQPWGAVTSWLAGQGAYVPQESLPADS